MTPPSQDRTGLPERLELDADSLAIALALGTTDERDNHGRVAPWRIERFKPIAAELVRRWNSHSTAPKLIADKVNELCTRQGCWSDKDSDAWLPKLEAIVTAALSAGIGQGE